MPRNIHSYHDKDWSQWFYYDETSPTCLRWKVSPARCRKSGDAAGNVGTTNRYFQVHTRAAGSDCVFSVHRIVFQLHNPGVEAEEIDHFDRDTRNNKISNLRAVTAAVNSKNKGKHDNNTSGVTGVSIRTHKNKRFGDYSYWTAQWYSKDGKPLAKSFSIKKYGDAEAFRLACEYRKAVIEQLNAEGANYTEGHGT